MDTSTEDTPLIESAMASSMQKLPSFSKTLVGGWLVAATLVIVVALSKSFPSPLQDFYSKITLPSLEHPCGKLSGVAFADMHDGDQKLVSIHHDKLIIEPAGTEETWIVHAKLDTVSCTAMVDFDVPDKPSPPPVPLLLTIWAMSTKGHSDGGKLTMEFTDPSETIAPKKMPLNHWVQIV